MAAAAHATLSHLFPSQKPFFDLKHAQAGVSGAALKKGHEFGLLVAKNILTDRKGDPDAGDDGYASSMARGAHRPDPDNPEQGYHAPFYGAEVSVLCCEQAAQTRRAASRSQATLITQRRFEKCGGKASRRRLMGTLPPSGPPNLPRRTADETCIGIYWGYDGAKELRYAAPPVQPDRA